MRLQTRQPSSVESLVREARLAVAQARAETEVVRRNRDQEVARARAEGLRAAIEPLAELLDIEYPADLDGRDRAGLVRGDGP